MTADIIDIRGKQNHWPLEWINPMDQTDTINTMGFVHPIGHWITVGGPLVGNEAQKVDLMTHPDSSYAHLVMTVVDIETMGVRNYVPRRDFEKISQLMERRRDDAGRAGDQAAETDDQTGGGEGLEEGAAVGPAQEAAGF